MGRDLLLPGQPLPTPSLLPRATSWGQRPGLRGGTWDTISEVPTHQRCRGAGPLLEDPVCHLPADSSVPGGSRGRGYRGHPRTEPQPCPADTAGSVTTTHYEIHVVFCLVGIRTSNQALCALRLPAAVSQARPSTPGPRSASPWGIPEALGEPAQAGRCGALSKTGPKALPWVPTPAFLPKTSLMGAGEVQLY